MHIRADHDAVAERQQVVVGDSEAVDVDAPAEPRAGQPQIPRPIGVPRNSVPQKTRTSCTPAIARAQSSSGHSISAIRISTSGGVRQRARRIVTADTGMSASANRMYDGTSSALIATTRVAP